MKKTLKLSLLPLFVGSGVLLWMGYATWKTLFPDPILTAAEAGDTATVEALLNKGANIEAKNASNAQQFYGETLGLNLLMDFGWIRTYGT